MSTIQTNAIVDAAGGNTATVNGISPLANTSRNGRNIIINGDMRVAQRGTSFTSSLFNSIILYVLFVMTFFVCDLSVFVCPLNNTYTYHYSACM